MKKQLLAFVVISFVLFNIGCKKPPTQPPDEKPTNCTYLAGNRNYTWRMDTVAWFPSTLGGVWAFSDSDAYLMGYIGEGKTPWRIFAGKHWDGTQWTTNINGTDEEVGHVANDVTGDDHFMVSVGNWYINPPKPALGEFDNRTKKWKHYQFQTTGELRSVWTDGKGYFITAGDNGMVYTKDDYTAEWVYQKAPTEFSFYSVTGIDKNEIYFWAYSHFASGGEHRQIWKLNDGSWIKMFDTQDTIGKIFDLAKTDLSNDIAVYKCDITDSLKIYIVGWESYLFEGKGLGLSFRRTNLSDQGLPLRSNGREAGGITLFTPNDIWIQGSRYNNYHWNGKDFQQMIIPGLPIDDNAFGVQLKVRKTSGGKVFYTSEVSSQVYVVLQGVP